MPMTIDPTWDLFIIVFFGLVVTYSFIIGKHEAVKVIIATYIAVLAVEGIGNILERFTGESRPLLDVLGLAFDGNLIIAAKLILFIALIVFIAVRGGVEIAYTKEPGGIVNTIITALFGLATAGLLLSTLLVFATDVPLLAPNLEQIATVAAVLKKSKLMEALVLNQDLLFSLPALLILAVGFLSNESEAGEE